MFRAVRTSPMACGIALAVSLPAAAAAEFAQTTYSGYLIDLYCLSLARTGGPAIDGSDVVKAPEDHTLHCLRDVARCREGIYLAGRDSKGEYDIKFLLDDASYKAGLAFMDSFPVGGERDSKFFAVTATGLHNGDGVLRGASFSSCFDSSVCDGVCNVTAGATCTTPANLDYELPAKPLLIAHAVCMCLSWGCMLPLGVLWARNLRQSAMKPFGSPLWFQGHRTLQSIGVLLQLAGFICIYEYKVGAHFKRPHEILGVIVFALGLWQPANALLRHFKFIGHPNPDGTRTAGRQVWEILHKGTGWVTLALGVANVCIGPHLAHEMRFDRALVLASGVFLAVSLGIQLLACWAFEGRRLLSYYQSQEVEQEGGRQKKEEAAHSPMA